MAEWTMFLGFFLFFCVLWKAVGDIIYHNTKERPTDVVPLIFFGVGAIGCWLLGALFWEDGLVLSSPFFGFGMVLAFGAVRSLPDYKRAVYEREQLKECQARKSVAMIEDLIAHLGPCNLEGADSILFRTRLPKWACFTWSSKQATVTRRSKLLMRCLSPNYFMSKREHVDWFQVESNVYGELRFRNIQPPDNDSLDDYPKRMLRLAHHIESLQMKVEFDSDILVQRLKTFADLNSPIEFELLFEALAGCGLRDEWKSMIESGRFPRCVKLVVEKDPEELLALATNLYGENSEEERVWATTTLLAMGQEDLVLGCLQNPPKGMSRTLFTRLGELQEPDRYHESLLSALQNTTLEVVEAAIERLGMIGSKSAVIALNDLRANNDSMTTSFTQLIDNSIASIQERLREGSGEGRLAIVDSDNSAGEVSLSSAQTGRIALAKQDRNSHG